jgi:hypothetical protein
VRGARCRPGVVRRQHGRLRGALPRHSRRLGPSVAVGHHGPAAILDITAVPELPGLVLGCIALACVVAARLHGSRDVLGGPQTHPARE